VNKRDKKKSELPLAPAALGRGLGTENPPTKAQWLIKTPPKSLYLKKKFHQSHVIIGGLGSLWGMNACFKHNTYALPSFMGRVEEHIGE
jgi:hypothetical protein